MNKTVKLIVGIACSAALVTPSYARGFGGGFGRGGGGFDRGGFGGGGFDRGSFGGGGFDRAGGGFDHAGYGGGFDRAGGSYAGRSEGEAAFPRSDYGGGGFGSIAGSRPATPSSFSQFSGHNPSQLAAEGGGFGSIAGHNDVSGQNFGNRANVGNSVNPTVNNYNHTYMSQGYHPSYNSSGYHNYGGYGDHPYGGYGYHGYGYGYHGYGYGYHGGFYGYPGCWNAGLAEASMWTCMGVSSLTSFLGIAALSSANSKQASNNVTYEGDNVYINGMPAQQYYQQGQQLAQTAGGNAYPNQNGTPFNQQVAYNSGGYGQMPNGGATASTNETWEPLGVYSLVEQGQSQSTMLFQLAINQQGIVRGNYVNQITNERAQIHGALDKSTQKISWSVGDNPDTIFDTTLSELMKEKSKVVVQFGPNNTQQMSLVREKAPAQNQSSTQTG